MTREPRTLNGRWREVVGTEDAGQEVGDFGGRLVGAAGELGADVNVAADGDDERELSLRQVPGDRGVAGDAAVVPDSAVEVEDAEAAALQLRVRRDPHPCEMTT